MSLIAQVGTGTRARRAYKQADFTHEAWMREIYVTPEGQRASEVLMSILRPEWTARYGGIGTQ